MIEYSVKTLVSVVIILFGIFLTVVNGLQDINALEVSSCTETKDGIEYTAQLANDGDPATCAKTCFQTGAWIRIPQTTSGYVNTIEMRGYMPEYTQIRIGDYADDYGFRANFSSNAPCILQTSAATDPSKAVIDYVFECSVARRGSIISFKSGDTDTSPQLILCEVNSWFNPSINI